MISLTRKIAAARPIWPILAVFSRRCGVSAMTEAGMAIANCGLVKIFRLISLNGLVLSEKQNINPYTNSRGWREVCPLQF
jgi:hypothetical protein